MFADLFVTGTDTGVGKTLLSALLVAALNRKYWKPIQTGACEGRDRETVMKWAGIAPDQTYPESYIFNPPVSPHLAAEQTGTVIDLRRIRRPASDGALIIEGAGGILAPISDDAFMSDLIRHLSVPVIVAARTALGTINHTLLTVAAIRNAQLDLRGVVMIGKENRDNIRAVERYGSVPVIGSIPWLETIDRQTLLSVFRQQFELRSLL
jgi:dethiobiotin synthetase